MKLLRLCLLFPACVPGTLAQSPLQSAISQLPQCAVSDSLWYEIRYSDETPQISCLVTAITHSPCTPTNQTCLCTNAPLQAEVTTCVTASCTIKEALSKPPSLLNIGKLLIDLFQRPRILRRPHAMILCEIRERYTIPSRPLSERLQALPLS
jgi:hypothetical protein